MDIAVIADDLTGANANGALLAAKGFSSATLLSLADLSEETARQYAAIAHSTDSRLLSPREAGARVRAAVAAFAAHRPALYAKRIDSTLRGNVGAEIAAALAAMEEQRAGAPSGNASPLAVVVPSFPASGRITSGGCLIVHGVPLERSPIAQDAATPIRNTEVTAIIAEQTGLPPGLVALPAVLAGPERVRAELFRLREAGCRVILCDAVTDADIVAIAEALRDVPFPVLAVDPGPFTAELAAVRVPARKTTKESRILAVVGSASELTRRQLEELCRAHATHLARLDCARVLAPATREAAIAEVVDFLRQAPADATVLGVCTAGRADDVLPLGCLAARHGMSVSAVSEHFNKALAEIARRVLHDPEMRIGGLYSSGGEVTVAVIRAAGGKGFAVLGEVMPLAAYGRLLRDGPPGIPMVTKGGFVGDAASLAQCIAYLLSRIAQ